jgi:hypothetical protein
MRAQWREAALNGRGSDEEGQPSVPRSFAANDAAASVVGDGHRKFDKETEYDLFRCVACDFHDVI